MVWFSFGIRYCLSQQVFWVQWKEGTEAPSKFSSLSSRLAALHFSDSIQNALKDKGFLQLEAKEFSSEDTFKINIEPGLLFFWKEVRRGNVPEDLWLKLGVPGNSYQAPYHWMDRLISLAEEKGYPFAKVSLDSVRLEGSFLFGLFDYEEGPWITWDSLEVSGDTKTQRRYLQQFSGLVPGASFSQTALEKSIQKIRRSPYFSLASVPQLNFQTKNAKPSFELKDRKINVFDGIIGLIPNQNQPGTMLITGELNLALYHLGGKGRDFSVQWQRLNIQSQTLEINAKESFLFRSPLDLQLDFSLLKQDSSFVNRTFQVDFGYRLSDTGYLRFFNRRQSGDLIGNSDQTASLPPALDYRWNQYGLGVMFDWLDDPVFARKGVKIISEFSLGNKRIVENTSIPEELYQGLELASPQYQGSLSVEKHLYVKPFWGMWLRGYGSFMKNENLFLNEFFRFGGLKTIRGFNEKFFFADRYAFLNLEQRFYVGQNSYLMVFGDLGVLQNPYFSPKIDRPASFGMGLNLDTDGGLFSFVFGLGQSNAQPLSFSYSRIHFGYLARF
ncbi:hypothetical protein DDT91_05980 [Algoriphagus sp. AK58]|nr:hypothetical protein [Algoriphagus sp. AK58]